MDPRFEQLFSRSLDGVFFATLDQPIRWDDDADKEGLLDYAFDHLRVTAVNQAICDQLRASRDELIGTTPRARWSSRVQAWRANQRNLFDRGQCHISARAARADGTPFEVEGTYACFYDQGGRLTGHFGIQRDITDRLRAQERLAMSERLASLATLAAGVGHEISNPLTYVISNLEMMQRELAALDQPEVPPAVRERLGGLRRRVTETSYGAERMREIVRDLRSLGERREPTEAVDVAAVIDAVVRLTDHELSPRARVVRETGPVPPVLGSEGRLIQVLVNLLLNAAQAIPSGDPDRHQIRIAAHPAPGGGVHLEVSDSGPGIAPEALSRIFDPFFTTREVGAGTGLGLAITHQIVTSLGGDIEVDSQPGRGTRVRVRLRSAA